MRRQACDDDDDDDNESTARCGWLTLGNMDVDDGNNDDGYARCACVSIYDRVCAIAMMA